jgi:hypothetical protein
MGRDFVVWWKVSIKFAGRSVTGSYALEEGMVKVKSARGGEKATQIGNSPAIVIARILLRELAAEGKA